jgi:hypothetical protein
MSAMARQRRSGGTGKKVRILMVAEGLADIGNFIAS